MKKLLLTLSFLTLIIQANAQWSGATPIINTSNTTSKTSPAAINDGSGNMIIAWVDSRNSATTGTDIYVQKINKDGTLPWGAEKVVCNALLAQSNVSLTSDGAGGAILVWEDARDAATANDIYAQRINNLGTVLWTTNGVAITTATGNQVAPIATMINATEAVIYWRDSRRLVLNNANPPVFVADQDPYCNKVLITDGAKQWGANDIQLSDAAGTQTNISMLPDGSGGVFLIWEDPTGTPTLTTDRDVFGQRLNNAGVKQWTPSSTIGLPLISVGGIQQTPAICPDGAGGFVAIFADQRSGVNGGGDIYAQRFNSSGAKVWANDVQVVSALGFQSNPTIVKSGSDFVAVWSDPRVATSDRNIYAQKLNSAGVLQWTAPGGAALDGIPICNVVGHQPSSSTSSGFVTVEDGLGGAFIVWDDARSPSSTTNSAIYAQHIKTDASLGYPVNGALIEFVSGTVAIPSPTQKTPVVIADGTGEIITAWTDSRVSSNGQIYAAKVKANGTLPVTYKSISANLNGNQNVLIKWEIASEINTENYVIERASDDGVFVAIGTVKAAKLSNYQFLDIYPITGNSYYRIKAVDFDGVISLSSNAVVKIATLNQITVTVYPNPATEVLNIFVGNIDAKNASYLVNIFDVNGQLKLSKSVSATANNAITIAVDGLATGVYTIQLADANNAVISVKKVIKL